jgi:hypothetical protein
MVKLIFSFVNDFVNLIDKIIRRGYTVIVGPY